VVLDRTLLATPAPAPAAAPPTPIARAPEPPAPVPTVAAEPIDAGVRAPSRPPERAAPVKVEPKSEPSEPAPPAGGRDLALSAERALLEVARTALARGEVAQALEALERHEHEAPRGRLVEEREALFVQALVRAGRKEAAEQRASAFRARFPDSLLMPAVDAALSP
ncbi:MAG: hypothetical protein K1X89_29825, partial [Myxococcaceae bacterium]|nr:hypothetical protein [Myxococcaceae bacterium]